MMFSKIHLIFQGERHATTRPRLWWKKSADATPLNGFVNWLRALPATGIIGWWFTPTWVAALP